MGAIIHSVSGLASSVFPMQAVPLSATMLLTGLVVHLLTATLGLVFTGCIAAVRPAGHGCIELPKSSQGRCWQDRHTPSESHEMGLLEMPHGLVCSLSLFLLAMREPACPFV